MTLAFVVIGAWLLVLTVAVAMFGRTPKPLEKRYTVLLWNEATQSLGPAEVTLEQYEAMRSHRNPVPWKVSEAIRQRTGDHASSASAYESHADPLSPINPLSPTWIGHDS